MSNVFDNSWGPKVSMSVTVSDLFHNASHCTVSWCFIMFHTISHCFSWFPGVFILFHAISHVSDVSHYFLAFYTVSHCL